MIEKQLGHVLSHYQIATTYGLKRLGNAGGFSGAAFWRMETDLEDYCLRGWPSEHPSRDRLSWIHHILQSAHANGCDFIPAPLKTRDGLATFVEAAGRLWEVSPWMPGTADFESDPNSARLNDAIRKLAKFHQSAAQVTLDFGRSDGIATRMEMLNDTPNIRKRVAESTLTAPHPCFETLRQRLLPIAEDRARQLANQLQPFVEQSFAVQPVIRDLWHDHLLFTENELTGIVDFGAMQIDTIALDLARLLGSLLGSRKTNLDSWGAALNAYTDIRLLQPQESAAINTLEEVGVFLGGLNWLQWIYVEKRKFEDWVAVADRVNAICKRLA